MATTPTEKSTAPEERETFSSSTGFILSAIGSAVGLGNIWRFPGVAYDSGGGAFLIPYIVALLTAGIPILFLDYAVGHRFRGAPPLAFRRLGRRMHGRRAAEALGWFQVGIAFVISTYYAAVIAWSLSYFWFSFGLRWGDDTKSFFTKEYLQVGDPGVSATLVPGVAIPLLLVWVTVIIVLALGVASGVQRVNVVFVPLLIVAFVGLVIRALTLPGAVQGLEALFTPDWKALGDPSVWIAAYSQIFFSLSIAFGIMITYSSFQRRKANMTSSGLVVAFANSSFEILAGIGVFATLGFFAHQQATTVGQLEGLTGPILSFVTFPAVISKMFGGSIFGALFFASLVLAGFTSIVSILLVVATAIDEKFGLGKKKAAIGVGVTCAVISMALFSTTTGLIALDTVDQWANNIGVVASAILAAVLVVWGLRRAGLLRAHLNAVSTFRLGRWWSVLIGVIVPVVLTVILVDRVRVLVTAGYEGYPGWYLAVFGWGAIFLTAVAAGVLTAIPWRGRDGADFTAWPMLDEEVDR